MNFLLDHDVPIDIARVLAQEGHQATRLIEVLSVETSDEGVFDFAQQSQFVLVTCNRNDFLRLAQRPAHAGLIILIRRKTRLAECAHLLQLLRRAGESGTKGNVNFA